MSNIHLTERPTDHIPFYVIISNFNSGEFESYDVMGYLIHEYKELKKSKRLQKFQPLPESDEQWAEFVKSKSMYMFWARCQYEITIGHWPPREGLEKKIDVHQQIMMNLPLVVQTLRQNLKK